jgi:hypothetical protein
MSVDTPQRRRRILQLVQNALPGSTVVFAGGTPGCLAFRIKSANGRYRSGTIKLLAHHRRIRLNRAWLQRQLEIHAAADRPRS